MGLGRGPRRCRRVTNGGRGLKRWGAVVRAAAPRPSCCDSRGSAQPEIACRGSAGGFRAPLRPGGSAEAAAARSAGQGLGGESDWPGGRERVGRQLKVVKPDATKVSRGRRGAGCVRGRGVATDGAEAAEADGLSCAPACVAACVTFLCHCAACVTV